MEARIFVYKREWGQSPLMFQQCDDVDNMYDFDSPRDSIYKKRLVVSRYEIQEQQWGAVSHQSISIALLEGTHESDGRSLVDMILRHSHVRDQMLGTCAAKLGASNKLRQNKQDALASPENDNKAMAGSDLSWRVGMQKESVRLLELIEAILSPTPSTSR